MHICTPTVSPVVAAWETSQYLIGFFLLQREFSGKAHIIIIIIIIIVVVVVAPCNP
jgi:hypothetical protein